MDTDNQKITPAFIRAMLHDSGITATQMARRLDVSETSISNVIKGKMTSKRIALAIAKQVGKTVDELWPGRYSDKAA